MFYFLGGVLVDEGASDVVCDEHSARIADGCGSKFNSGVERWCVSGDSVVFNVSAVLVSLGGVCLVCADSVFKLALTKEGAKSEKAKVDQCCSTFRLQGLWPIYTATWLSLWIWLRVLYGFYFFYLVVGGLSAVRWCARCCILGWSAYCYVYLYGGVSVLQW